MLIVSLHSIVCCHSTNHYLLHYVTCCHYVVCTHSISCSSLHFVLLFILPLYQSFLPPLYYLLPLYDLNLIPLCCLLPLCYWCHFIVHSSFHSIVYNHSTICSLLPFVVYCHSTIHSSLHFVVCYHFASHSSLHYIICYHFAIQSSFHYVDFYHFTSCSSFHFIIPYLGFNFFLHTWTLTKSGHCIHLCTSFELSSKLSSSTTPLHLCHKHFNRLQ